MRGSPTLLINGYDPFAVSETVPALACRIYRGEGGRLEGAPAVEALRQALERAGMPASRLADVTGRPGAGPEPGTGRPSLPSEPAPRGQGDWFR
jgi:hypothetical protein